MGDLLKQISNNQTDIRTSGDIVSALSIPQKGKNKITIKQNNPFKAHGLKNLKQSKKLKSNSK